MRSGRDRSNPASWARTTLGLGAVTGLIVVIALASAVQGVPVIAPPSFVLPSLPPIEQTPMASAGPGELPTAEPVDPVVSSTIQLIIALVMAALAALLLVWLVRRLRDWLRERRVHSRTGALVVTGITGELEPAPDAPTIRRGVAAALAELDRGRAASDAIVAAWIGLEESAADAGLLRMDTETAGEFVTRILARDGRAAADVTDLLRLYEDVRFGGHDAADADRAAARAALQRIAAVWV